MSKELIYLVGIPASGKSTYIKEHYPNHIVVSNDLIVERYAKLWNTDYNTAWKKLSFKTVNNETRAIFEWAIENNCSIVIDNTNLTPKARRKYKTNNYKKIAIVFSISDNEHNKRIEKRKNETGKLVPYDVVENMKRSFVYPTKEEGFDEIIEIKG